MSVPQPPGVNPGTKRSANQGPPSLNRWRRAAKLSTVSEKSVGRPQGPTEPSQDSTVLVCMSQRQLKCIVRLETLAVLSGKLADEVVELRNDLPVYVDDLCAKR